MQNLSISNNPSVQYVVSILISTANCFSLKKNFNDKTLSFWFYTINSSSSLSNHVEKNDAREQHTVGEGNKSLALTFWAIQKGFKKSSLIKRSSTEVHCRYNQHIYPPSSTWCVLCGPACFVLIDISRPPLFVYTSACCKRAPTEALHSIL